MDQQVKTIVKLCYCEYAGRSVPVSYTYVQETLLSIECPKSGCRRLDRCPAWQSPPSPPGLPE